MIAQLLPFHLRGVLVGLVAVAAVSASPALANSANADIAAPLRAAEAERGAAGHSGPANGDREFRALFASWRALDTGFGFAAARTGGFMASALPTVAIPSRSPVDSYRMTSDFGMRWHPVLGGRRPHKGIDLADPTGTPVHATADGVIGRADWFSGYGLCVEIEHGGSLETRYGHMSRLNVAAGQMVRKGDVIGFVGATGRATGPHLHYEVRVNGIAVNPMPYMQGTATVATVKADATSAPALAAASADTDGGDE